MKTSFTSSILIAAALGATALTPLSATPKNTIPVVYRVSVAYPLDTEPVTIGASRADVVESMGEPNWKVTPDIWVYYRYHAVDMAQADHDGCNAMLVTFTGKTVSDLKLANKGALKIYAATLVAQPMNLFASGK